MDNRQRAVSSKMTPCVAPGTVRTEKMMALMPSDLTHAVKRHAPSASDSVWNALLLRILCASLIALSHAASATSIKVLWYTYADPASEYVSFYSSLAGTGPGNAGSYPEGSGLTWDLTYFGPSSPAPVFSDYNVLVIHGGEAFRTQPPGGALATPNFSGILSNKIAIEEARGNRTFLSGSDADFHAVRGDSGLCPDVHCGSFNGARGYVINAVDWAGRGAGLGILSFYHGEFPGSFWWDDPNSFLRSELHGNWFPVRQNALVIPSSAADFAANQGLTSDGLSNWFHSFHGGFSFIPGYSTTVEAAGGASVSVANIALCQPSTGILCISTGATLEEPSSASLLFIVLLLVTFNTKWLRSKLLAASKHHR